MKNFLYIDQEVPIFMLPSSGLENRLDPYYYNSALKDFTSSNLYEIVKISEVVYSFQSGFGVGRQDQAEESKESIIQIRPTNLDKFGLLKFDKNVFIPKTLINSDNHLLEYGDVVFNNTNSQEWVGKTAYYDLTEKMAFSNHITVLKAKQNKILPQYLWIILNVYQQKKIFFSICTNWNNQSGIGLELLKSLKIPLPTIPQQQEIIDIWNTAINSKQQKQAEAQSLLESIDDYLLTELGITLPEKDNSLKNRIFTTSSKDVSGKRFDPSANYYERIKTIQAIKNSKFEAVTLKKIFRIDNRLSNESDSHYLGLESIESNTGFILSLLNGSDYSSALEFNENDILFSKLRPYLNKVYFATFKGICSTEFHILKPLSKEIDPTFYSIFLRSKAILNQTYHLMSGNTLPRLQTNDILELVVPKVDFTLQLVINKFYINNIDKVKFLQKEADYEMVIANKRIENIILKN